MTNHSLNIWNILSPAQSTMPWWSWIKSSGLKQMCMLPVWGQLSETQLAEQITSIVIPRKWRPWKFSTDPGSSGPFYHFRRQPTALLQLTEPHAKPQCFRHRPVFLRSHPQNWARSRSSPKNRHYRASSLSDNRLLQSSQYPWLMVRYAFMGAKNLPSIPTLNWVHTLYRFEDLYTTLAGSNKVHVAGSQACVQSSVPIQFSGGLGSV